MKNKPIIIMLVILLAVSLSLGVFGLVLSKKISAQIDNTPKITYEYYLEEEKVDAMPVKEDEDGNTYEYSKYVCDNNMTINFDKDTWRYTTANEADGTCKLYFVKGTYVVELTTTNGLVNGEESIFSTKVARGMDEQINIVPNEGYEYDGEVICSNEKEVIYDISTNMLNINSVSEDVACKINFSKKNLQLDIVVKNGTGSTTENKDYGESISAIVQPNEGYEKPKITCTNKQEYTYEDNKLTIQKLTADTVCTVTFSKTPAVTYNLTIDTIPEEVIITSGNKKQSVVSGKDGKFSLKALDGYTIVLDCNGVKPSTEKEDNDGSITYTFLGMSRNITCSITAQPEETTNNESGY